MLAVMTQPFKMMQDLSMGWLNCEPDELFKPKVFSASGIAGLIPARLASLLSPFASLLTAAGQELGLGSLATFTFVARPIQVRAPSIKLAGKPIKFLISDFRL